MSARQMLSAMGKKRPASTGPGRVPTGPGSPVPLPAKHPAFEKKSGKKKWLLLALVVLLLGLTAWFFWPDPLAGARQKLAEARTLPREKRRDAVREALKDLSRDQRRRLFSEGRDARRKRWLENMKKYFAMSPGDKTKHLDDLIDRMEEWRKRRQEERPQRADNNPPQQRRRLSAEERERRMKQRLDNSSPEERAMRFQFRRDMQNRMLQRGIGGGGWGGGWGGGRRP
jgi:hypothetical protein